MGKVKAVNSNQDTAYASQATYKVETMWVKDNIDPNKNKNSTNNELHDQGLPSNLEYVDSFHDASTGTSGTAFKDTTTGEIIIAYTGTNPAGDDYVIKLHDVIILPTILTHLYPSVGE